MQIGNANYIYKNDLDKACVQHDVADGKYKALTKRTESDKVLKDKAFNFASNSKYHGSKRISFNAFQIFDKKSKSSGLDYMLNQQFENELHKPIIRIFEKERFIF